MSICEKRNRLSNHRIWAAKPVIHFTSRKEITCIKFPKANTEEVYRTGVNTPIRTVDRSNVLFANRLSNVGIFMAKKATKKKAAKKSVKKVVKKVVKKKAAPKKKVTKPKVKRQSKLMQTTYTVSPELQAVVGGKTMTRPQIVKKLWEYIKKHKCQDTKNKRMINPDKTLAEVIGSRSVDMLKLAGLLSKHIKK